MSTRTGVLLVNLGTPDAPQTPEVRRYLREFLSDPRVVDINAVGRWLLLNLIILPRRPAKSAEAYRVIWDERGSPLLYHTEDLAAALRERLGEAVPVVVGMRYGSPSIRSAIAELTAAGVERIVLLPLFPQYSTAAWGSAVEKVMAEAAARWNIPAIDVVPPFYDDPGFVAAVAAQARPVLDDLAPDKVVISFHGVPERHCTQSDTTGAHCLKREGCCDAIVEANRYCYRAQCFASARAIAAALELADGTWEVTFQSRLGRTPWIRPYTDVRLQELPGEGVKKVAVLSPSFVADCLETLEEIGVRAVEDFTGRGGEELRLVPSLNATAPWVDAVEAMVRPYLAAASAQRAEPGRADAPGT